MTTIGTHKTARNNNPQALRLSIIIVSYNCRSHLPELLSSIAEYAPRQSFEIMVIDNASTDETANWCRSTRPDIRLLVNDQNLGFAAAANRGTQKAGGELFLFCNPDLRFTSPVADRLIEFVEGHPSCGAAAARLVFPDGTFQPSCRNFPTFSNIWFSRGSPFSRWFRPTGKRWRYTLGDCARPLQVDATAATCVLIPRAVWEKLGGFDERFFMFAEDTDFCRRLPDAGYETWFVPAATAVHHWGGSKAETQLIDGYYRDSLQKYFRKHFPHARVGKIVLSWALFLARGFGRRRSSKS